MKNIDFRLIKTNGISLHIAVAGPEEGPLVILLHGFPEFWYGWRKQISTLAEAGYRVIVPDQRGYNLSEKPTDVEEYTIDKLRDDVMGLIEFFGREKATIIGHDWGALVAWHLASTRSTYVDKVIPINVPHPAIFMRNVIKHPTQMFRSSYILFFQTPKIPEKLLSANHYQAMKNMMRISSNTGAFTHEDLQQYEAAWSKRNALTSMLNWYRAIRAGTMGQISNDPVTVPVRMIWGRKDHFLLLMLAKESMKLCKDGKLTMVQEATHWIHHEQPDVLNKLILNALNEA
ncbi:alpha/beta fold hydrolase [Alkalihalobacterium chitinilyticum]|uniref:Alpha/beta hydrolase n=1 Tax=Alkalihalobacterium chitinilyticum TaxID=2980103 RepID=A0ABT5VL25_9BACI|nr:alpha/beta hydrolase [Alkalihalobacterium chitinilyticum]MDE5416148.1 alpha/beta hydrolase [Alkalihalobacterium chitinilyticum]